MVPLFVDIVGTYDADRAFLYTGARELAGPLVSFSPKDLQRCKMRPT